MIFQTMHKKGKTTPSIRTYRTSENPALKCCSTKIKNQAYEAWFFLWDQRRSLSMNSSTMIERIANRTVNKRRCPQQL